MMPPVSIRLQRVNWDAVGVGASTLCVIHCLLLPVVLAFAPTLAHFLPGNEAVRRSLAYLLTGVGILAFRAGYRVHRKKFVLVLLMAGIAAVIVGSHTPAPCFPLTHGKAQSHSLAALS